MNRWLAMILTCFAIAFGPIAPVASLACAPRVEGCGESCCCGDESACPCIDSAPDEPKQPAAPARSGEDVRPVLLPPEPATNALAAPQTVGATDAAPSPVVALGSVRSQALLCRWRT